MYIIFEGIVGSGKTTQSKKLAEYLKKKFPKKKVVWTREPGGSEIADEIRRIVQGTKFRERMPGLCEVYLYASSRAHLFPTLIMPTLNKGGIVVSDRSFITSIANQAFGRGVGIEEVLRINEPIFSRRLPDYVIYIEVPIKRALKMLKDADGDKFERLGPAFHRRARKGYKEASKLKILKKKWITIDGNQSEEEVFKDIIKALRV